MANTQVEQLRRVRVVEHWQATRRGATLKHDGPCPRCNPDDAWLELRWSHYQPSFMRLLLIGDVVRGLEDA